MVFKTRLGEFLLKSVCDKILRLLTWKIFIYTIVEALVDSKTSRPLYYDQIMYVVMWLCGYVVMWLTV